MKREFRDYDDDDFNETDEEADDMNLIREGDEQSLSTTYIQYHHRLVRKFWVVVEKITWNQEKNALAATQEDDVYNDDYRTDDICVRQDCRRKKKLVA